MAMRRSSRTRLRTIKSWTRRSSSGDSSSSGARGTGRRLVLTGGLLLARPSITKFRVAAAERKYPAATLRVGGTARGEANRAEALAVRRFALGGGAARPCGALRDGLLFSGTLGGLFDRSLDRWRLRPWCRHVHVASELCPGEEAVCLGAHGVGDGGLRRLIRPCFRIRIEHLAGEIDREPRLLEHLPVRAPRTRSPPRRGCPADRRDGTPVRDDRLRELWRRGQQPAAKLEPRRRRLGSGAAVRLRFRIGGRGALRGGARERRRRVGASRPRERRCRRLSHRRAGGLRSGIRRHCRRSLRGRRIGWGDGLRFRFGVRRGCRWRCFARRLRRGELRERERQIAQESRQIELLLAFEQPRERGRDPFQSSAAELLHDPRKVGKQPPLRFEPLVQRSRESERGRGLLDVPANSIAQRRPAPAALGPRRLRLLLRARAAARPHLSSRLSRHPPSFNRIAAPDASEGGVAESAFVCLLLFDVCATRPDMPSLRPYAEQDWPHFLQLDLETAIDALGESNEDERRKLREGWPQKLATQGFTPPRFAVPQAQLLVLQSDQGEYLGHLWITEREDASGKRILEVTTMGIRRDSRGQGLGRLLMQRAEAEASQRRIEDIELSVAGNNRRARDLYRDLGYETVRRTMRKRLRG